MSQDGYWLPQPGRGFWSALVAGPAIGCDRTGLGVALYGDDHRLARYRLEPFARAVWRGDLPVSMEARRPGRPPASVESMRHQLGSTGNAMSIVRWEGLMPTLAWDEDVLAELFAHIVPRLGHLN